MSENKNASRGERIRRFRESLELTQEQFGKLIRDERGTFGKSAIANYESGLPPGRRAERRILEEAAKAGYTLTYEDLHRDEY